MIIEAHGIHLKLPRGWSGRVFRRDEKATLHAADFQLAVGDGEFGDRSTTNMPSVASFVALTEYLPGRGLQPGTGLFAAPHVPRRLDPSSFKASCLAHPRPGHVGMQHFFTASDRPLCLYVVLSGNRAGRRHQLAVLDQMLETLRIGPRS